MKRSLHQTHANIEWISPEHYWLEWATECFSISNNIYIIALFIPLFYVHTEDLLVHSWTDWIKSTMPHTKQTVLLGLCYGGSQEYTIRHKIPINVQLFMTAIHHYLQYRLFVKWCKTPHESFDVANKFHDIISSARFECFQFDEIYCNKNAHQSQKHQ